MRREVGKLLMIILGMVSASFGLKGFLLSSHFIDGGVTGISMLLADIFNLPLSLLLLLINLPSLPLPTNRLENRSPLRAFSQLRVCRCVLPF